MIMAKSAEGGGGGGGGERGGIGWRERERGEGKERVGGERGWRRGRERKIITCVFCICIHVHVYDCSFREIFDSKIKEYQEAQQKKKTKEIEELVERCVTAKCIIALHLLLLFMARSVITLCTQSCSHSTHVQYMYQ